MLLPAQQRVISFQAWQAFDSDDFEASLSVQSLNAVLAAHS